MACRKFWTRALASPLAVALLNGQQLDVGAEGKKRTGWVLYLRSSAICATLSGRLAFFSNISACSTGPSSTAATSRRMIPVGVGAFHVFHRLILIRAVLIWGYASHLCFDIDLLTLKQAVHYLTQLQISGTEPCWIALRMLTLGLQPE
jgi:hypothetical protein